MFHLSIDWLIKWYGSYFSHFLLYQFIGLKAVDLAIRNKQEKSRDLLAEYHLHYCTSSDFDSVLFLKTLEVSLKREIVFLFFIFLL